MPDEAFITRPMDDGEPVSNEEIPLRMLRWLAEQTAFLSNDQGWEASGQLAPWNRIRREKRTFRVVLEPYVWIWDRRTDTTSPFVEPARRRHRPGRLLAGTGPPAGAALRAARHPVVDQPGQHR